MADSRIALIAGLIAVSACTPQREVGPHAPTSLQQPIEPACGRDLAPLAASGLVVQTSFERETRARSRILNRGKKTRVVAPQAVSLCAGPCGGHFAGCVARKSWDESSAEPAYAVTLAPGEALDLDVDAALAEPASSCEKVALIATLDVDGTRSCGELGNWIALSR